MKRLLLLLLLLISNLIFAQQQRKLDSLKVILAKLPVEGRSLENSNKRINLLLEIAQITSSVELCINSFEEALNIAVKNKDNVKYCEIGLKYAKTINKNQSFYKIGELLLNCLAKAEEIKKNELLAELHYSLGTNYYNLSDYMLSRSHLFKAQTFFEVLNDNEGVIKVITFIGNTYLEENKNSEGIKYYNRAYYLAKKLNIKNRIPNILSNIGLGFEQEKRLDSALHYVNKALFELSKIQPIDKDLKTGTLIEKAYIYYLLNNHNLAIENGRLALKECPPKNIDFISYAHRVLFRAYNAKKDYKNAIENLIKFKSLRDSLDTFNREQQINSLKAIYLNEKSINKVNNLNYTVRSLIILSIIILVFMLFFWFTKNKIRKQNEEILLIKFELESLNESLEERVSQRTNELLVANEELSRKNKEISEALFKGQSIERHRLSSELHDNLGGTLSSINWRLQALNKDSLSEKDIKIYESIINMTKNAYSDIRLLSHNLLPKTLEEYGLKVTLQRLISDLNENKTILFRFETDINDRLEDNMLELNIYAITLELINNIIKHSKATNAEISINKEKDFLILFVSDNGIGIQQNKSSSSGISLKSLEKRVEIVRGTLNIQTESSGTSIFIRVPISQRNIELVTL